MCDNQEQADHPRCVDGGYMHPRLPRMPIRGYFQYPWMAHETQVVDVESVHADPYVLLIFLTVDTLKLMQKSSG